MFVSVLFGESFLSYILSLRGSDEDFLSVCVCVCVCVCACVFISGEKRDGRRRMFLKHV